MSRRPELPLGGPTPGQAGEEEPRRARCPPFIAEGSSIAEALEYAPLSEILAPLPEILGGRGLKQAGATGGAPEVTLPPTAAATLPAEVLPLEFTPIPEFVRGARGLKQV